MKLPLKLAITVILLAVIVWRLEDPRQIGQLLVRIDPRNVMLILAIYTIDRALMTYKWGLLLRSRRQHLPFFRGLRIYCASMVWGMFLPMTVGSDAIRAFSTSRSGLSADEVVASIFIERVLGFIAALLLGLFSLCLLFITGDLDTRFRPLWWLGSLALLGATFAFAVSFSRMAFDFLYGRVLRSLSGTPIIRWLRQSHLTYLAYRHEKRSLATFFALTVVQQLSPTLILWLVARALGVEVSLLYMACLVPLAFLITRLPISISGLGVFEGVFMLLAAVAGLTPAESVAIALAARIMEVASLLPWWFAHVVGYGQLRPPRLAVE